MARYMASDGRIASRTASASADGHTGTDATTRAPPPWFRKRSTTCRASSGERHVRIAPSATVAASSTIAGPSAPTSRRGAESAAAARAGNRRRAHRRGRRGGTRRSTCTRSSAGPGVTSVPVAHDERRRRPDAERDAPGRQLGERGRGHREDRPTSGSGREDRGPDLDVGNPGDRGRGEYRHGVEAIGLAGPHGFVAAARAARAGSRRDRRGARPATGRSRRTAGSRGHVTCERRERHASAGRRTSVRAGSAAALASPR